MRIYWIYKQRFIVDWEFTQDSSLNWLYDLSFFLDYPEYKLETLKVEDWILTNTEKRFFVAEYDENIITQDVINFYMLSIPKEFQIEMFTTIEEAREWVRKNTSLLEENPGKFKISDEIDMMWEIIPAHYLEIN